MIHRFAEFEIDEARRELRLRGRELPVQPRVFAMLAYFARNPDRVIGKEELLDTLWPGTVVVDGALQRVVSLARSALREGELHDAIRTYSRHGYRFCAAVESAAAHAPDAASASGALARAQALFAAGDWQPAAAAFATADREAALTATELERWAHAALWAGHGTAATEPLERAVAAYLIVGDRRGAARAAVQRSMVALERLELAVAKGWQRRADSHLQGDERCREYGLSRYASVRMALVEGEADRAYEEAQLIHEIGRELEDADLEGLGLVYSGHALLTRGDVAQGLDLQSEAAAAVLSGEITPWIGSVIYCSLIWTCRNRGDWQRASQWTQNFQRWCDRHRLAAFPGTCRLHRAEVLSVSGHVVEAEAELDESRAALETWAPWALGEVQRVLGDLHLAKGDLDRAEEAYRRSREHGWNPQPGHAMLQVARGNPSAAVRALETSLADPSWIPREGRGTLLAHLAMAATAAGALDKARAALAELDAHPEHRGTPAFSALHRAAHATLLGAEDRAHDSAAAWRAAIRDWHEVGSPLYAAHARLGLGRALLASGERDEAREEIMAARAVFERVGAHAPAAQCAALLELATSARDSA